MTHAPAVATIEVRIKHLDQLFNVIDPAPFHDKALDPDAAAFIIDDAEEASPHAALALTVHLDAGTEAVEYVPEAIRNFFAWRADRTAHELRQLRTRGRRSLLVGLVFLALCLVLGQLVHRAWPTGPVAGYFQEGLTIVGWVALWRPLDALLYEWWPIRRREQLLRRLARAEVDVRIGPGPR
ncbi:MAG: hypothetical protein ABIQ41_01665 [Gemmatimonadales bacterium]